MDTSNGRIGFIGAGNMANAMIKGLINSELYVIEQLTASDNDMEKLKTMSERFGLKCCTSNMDIVRECRIIVLAVKPQVIRAVLEEVKDEIRDEHLIISIAAGIPIRMIHAIIGRDIPIIRVMPNTPALIQRGISALASGKMATPDHMLMARGIFNAVGKTVVVDEKMMDAVTAISGSGPGYIFKIMECFVDAAQKLGFDKEMALLLVIQTILGSAHLAEASESSLSELRGMVTAPGGTTAAALAFFEEKGLSDVIQGAVESACNRSVELGENY
ncbi:pyrroline-5-carboxylate reductase [Thermodesulfobacteriota bacterium]